MGPLPRISGPNSLSDPLNYSALSYNNSQASWPRGLVLLSLGTALILLGVDGASTTESGKAALTLIHVSLFYFAVSDAYLYQTFKESGETRHAYHRPEPEKESPVVSEE